MRGATKLDAALDALEIDVEGLTAADLGCNIGGFTEVLLGRGACRVFAIDTGYGMLAAHLRADPRVVAMERTNALHVRLDEPVDLVVADMAWTQQRKVIPAALAMTRAGGRIVSLLKPHYEAPERTQGGVLDPETALTVAEETCKRLGAIGYEVRAMVAAVIPGAKGNQEFFILIENS